MENPVKSPIVPPMAESMSTNFAALSFVTLSNTGELNDIFTNLNGDFFKLYSKQKNT